MKYKLLPTMLCILFLSSLVAASFTSFDFRYSPKYDAYTRFVVGPDDTSERLLVDDDSGLFGFDANAIISYNLTGMNITNTTHLTVINVSQNFTYRSGSSFADWGAWRMNGTDVNNNSEFSPTVVGMINDEGRYVPSWFGLVAQKNYQFGLGSTAIGDVQNQTVLGYFTIGISEDLVSSDTSTTINSSRSSSPPDLIVNTDCSPPPVGDWIINITCEMIGEEVFLTGSRNLLIQDNGFLILLEGSNITFSGTNQFINAAVGAELNMCVGCALPK